MYKQKNNIRHLYDVINKAQTEVCALLLLLKYICDVSTSNLLRVPLQHVRLDHSFS